MKNSNSVEDETVNLTIDSYGMVIVALLIVMFRLPALT